MTRDLRRLADTRFDLLVVGAGIYGATIAWDAALRGLSVAIVDRDDFGSATSANSLKTIHGGLRSLQRGALPEMRQFIRERRTLLRVAPHVVRPLTFLVPTTRHPVRNRAVMRIALAINDLVARDRNDGVLPERHLHDARIVGLPEVRRVAGDLDLAGVTGGASWCDAQMLSSERLTFEFVASAAARGACAANHAAVTSFLVTDGRVEGARVRDLLGDDELDVRASMTINAAGAWAAELSAAACGLPPASLSPALSRALNVVTARPAGPCAVGGLSEGRFFFRVPWRGVTMYGTSHDPFEGSANDVRPDARAVDGLLADVNRAFPGHPVAIDDVTFVHWGLLPARRIVGAHVELSKHSVVRDHRADGVQGLVTVIGVRYTTARDTAQAAVDLALGQITGATTPPASATTPLQGGADYDEAALCRAVPRAWSTASDADVARLVRTYGARLPDVLTLLRHDATLSAPLGAACPVTTAEVVHAVQHEAAVTLPDLLLRRTEAGTAGHPGHDAVQRAADLMAGLLGWSAVRQERDIEAVEARYRLAEPSPGRG